MPPSVATRTREADVDTRVTLATRLERPASTARDGRSGSDSIKHAATGEVKAIRGESTKYAYFGYDGPTLDHPAFPGVAAEVSVSK